MIRLEVYGEPEAMDAVAQLLDGNDEVGRVRHASAARPGYAIVIAIVQPRAVDECSETSSGSACRRRG